MIKVEDRYGKDWKPLIHNGVSFGSSFKISEDGNIKNIKTHKIMSRRKENKKEYATIYMDGKVYRIDIQRALLESGHNEDDFKLEYIHTPIELPKSISPMNRMKIKGEVEKLIFDNIDWIVEMHTRSD